MFKRKASLKRRSRRPKEAALVGGSSARRSTPTSLASFDYLNNDCLVNTLSFLTNDDMNNVAICSRACREARSNESLDQTRTGTIICSANTTVRSICDAIVDGDWSSVFTGNRSNLKIDNVAKIRPDRHVLVNAKARRGATLFGVLSLDLSCVLSEADGR